MDTERERDLEIADDYIPYENDLNVPGDIYNDVIENKFGHGNKRSKVIKLTQVQRLENGKPGVRFSLTPPLWYAPGGLIITHLSLWYTPGG